MNIQHNLIDELMLYEFKLNHDVIELNHDVTELNHDVIKIICTQQYGLITNNNNPF